MKKYFTALILLSAWASVASQNLDGKYRNGGDSLCFSNGKAIFNLSGFGALSIPMAGEGEYEHSGNYLLVNAGEYSGQKSRFEPTDPSKRDTIVVKVIDSDNYSVRGVLVEFLSESDKTVRVGITDERGRAEQPYNPKIKRIKISGLGYQEVVFGAEKGKDFLVKLVKCNIIENRTVVFKISEEENETLSVVLLSDRFEPGKDRAKSLRKLDKKAQKNNILPKRLKKEYIRIYGK